MSRRPTLTLEEREERQRNRWRKQKARERKESADSQWLCHTNFGYFEEPEVLHWHQFVEYLVASRFLAEIDAENKPRICEAADRLLEWYVGDEDSVVGLRPGPDFVGKSGAGIDTVRIKITMRLVEALGLTHECDNRCKIKQAAEELIFALYSNIGDIFRPTPWPTTGKQWMRPLYDPLQIYRNEYLRSRGLVGEESTKFRQDLWDPGAGEGLPPGGMHNADGLMEGRRRRPFLTRDSGDYDGTDFE